MSDGRRGILQSVEEWRRARRMGYAEGEWKALAQRVGLKELLLSPEVRLRVACVPYRKRPGPAPMLGSGEPQERVTRMVELAAPDPRQRLA